MKMTIKQQHLIHVSSATATGNLDALKNHLHTALSDGVTVNELKELLIQLYAYCGFPRSLNGLTTLMTVLAQRAESGTQDAHGKEPKAIPADKSKYDLGDMVQQQLVGQPVQGPIFDFAPAIDVFLKEHLFADIFLRGVLTYQEREIITIAALACLEVTSQLNSHIRIGMNTGLSHEQIQEIANILEQNYLIQAASSINTILSAIQ